MHNCCGKNKIMKLLMILCCVIPLVIVSAVFFTKSQSASWGSVTSFGLLLLCPLSHLLLLPLLMRKKKGEDENKPSCH